jgi:hypothetical protein
VDGFGTGDGFGVHAWCLGPAQDRGDNVPDRNLPALLLQQTKKHLSGLKFSSNESIIQNACINIIFSKLLFIKMH